MKPLEIITLTYGRDNFCFLLHQPGLGLTALVDAGDDQVVLKALAQRGWSLDLILLTHLHHDHVEGLPGLQKAFPQAQVLAGAASHGQSLQGGQNLDWGDLQIQVLDLASHSAHDRGFLVEGNLFTGDVLFSAGCGRLFDGTAQDLLKAMDQIAALPPQTVLHVGHEYTLSNLAFAQAVEPENQAIGQRLAEVKAILAQGGHSSPTLLSIELATNPFLRIDQPALMQALDKAGQDSRSQRLGKLRGMKDRF